ncbi:unnamed protein product, partial [Heterosigma akashiwo]
MAYLDDVFIASDTAEQHIQDVKDILKRLREAGLRTRPDKTSLFKKEVKALGHIMGEDGLRPIGEKINAIRDKVVPRTRKGIQSFLGLVRYYARYVNKLSDMAIPLNVMLRKDVNVSQAWTNEQDEAVRKIKEAFSNVDGLVLTRYNPDRPLLLQTDASGFAMGAVLSHYKEEGGKRISEDPICFASKSFSKHQKNYSTTERECLAVVWACDMF